MNRVLIWDIESYLYKALTACKVLQQCKTDKTIYGEYYDLKRGYKYFQEQLDRLMQLLKADTVEFVIGDVNNWRKLSVPTYKSNRLPKPEMYNILLEYLQEKYGQFSYLANLEADDTCRIMYEDPNFYPDKEKIIVGIDKDFYSVPCKFYRDLPSNTDGVVEISEDEAMQHLLLQIIMGDKTDGYDGIKGYGEVKAKAFLQEGNKTFADVLELFQKNGLTGTEYVRNKVCATIVGYKQYDFQTGKVNLNKG